jgi:hypothetical protein
MRKTILAAGVILALTMTLPAFAARAFDAKDAPPTPLDIRVLRVHAERGGMGRVTIKTFGAWRSRYLRASKDTALGVRFDDGDDADYGDCGQYGCGGGRFEVAGNFRYRHGELIFALSKMMINNDLHESFPAHHPNRHTVTVRFSFDQPYFKEAHLSAAASAYDAEECGETRCYDYAPNHRPWPRLY